MSDKTGDIVGMVREERDRAAGALQIAMGVARLMDDHRIETFWVEELSLESKGRYLPSGLGLTDIDYFDGEDSAGAAGAAAYARGKKDICDLILRRLVK